MLMTQCIFAGVWTLGPWRILWTCAAVTPQQKRVLHKQSRRILSWTRGVLRFKSSPAAARQQTQQRLDVRGRLLGGLVAGRRHVQLRSLTGELFGDPLGVA